MILKETQKVSSLSDMPPFIYGTTRLGHDDLPIKDRVRFAIETMEKVSWFHTSHQYNSAPQVLNAAFKQNKSHIPKLMVKIGGNTLAELRTDVLKNLALLELNNFEIGQLCLGGELATDYAKGGDVFYEFEKLKKEGLVNRFVMEVFPWTSKPALDALKNGYPKGIVEGYIFYFNPLQRFATNELWNLLMSRNIPIIGLRTVSGGPVHRLRDVPGAAWKEYLQKRATEVAPIFEKSGIANWTEFCLRFSFSFSQLKATVGSTCNSQNLTQFIEASKTITPLPQPIVDDIVKLHERWSDELDVKAEPWTM